MRANREIAALIMGRPVDEVQVIPVRPTYGDFASQEWLVQVRVDGGWATILTAAQRDLWWKLRQRYPQGAGV